MTVFNRTSVPFGSRNPETRNKLVSNLKSVVSRQIPGFSALRFRPGSGGVSVEDYFQQKPLTSSVLTDVYGSSEDFLKSYEDFAETYYKTIGNRSNLKKGVNVDVDLERAMGRIDLKLLNAEMKNKLYDQYTEKVLRLPDLIRKGGLPTMQMPSGNMYSESFKYLTAFEDMSNGKTSHVAKTVLNRLYFSFNSRKEGLEGFTVSKSNIISPENIRQTHEQLSGGFFANLKKGTSVATLDIETTGVFQLSQARSFSVSKQIVEKSGTFSFPVPEPSRIFTDSPQLGGVRVGQKGGGSRSLSELLTEISGPDAVKVKTPEMLDSLAELFETLNSQDMVIGHNLNFDLQKLVDTAQDIEGFGEHRLKQLMVDFFNKKKQGGFVYDTLDVAREYLNDKVMKGIEDDAVRRGVVLDNLFGTALSDEISLREKKYIEDLFAQETLAKVHLGGSAAPFSMENIALNTNLFSLIEKDGQAASLIDLLNKGTHIEQTDTVLQGYVLRYIQTGELDVDRSTTTTGLTDFVRFSRRKVSQSSAITPTTNIADISHISDEFFRHVAQKDNLRGVSVSISELLPDSENIVRQMGLESELIRGAGFAPEHRGLAKNVITINDRGQVELLYHRVVPAVPGQPAIPDRAQNRKGRKGKGAKKGKKDVIIPGRPAVPPVPEKRFTENLLIEGQQADDIKSAIVEMLQKARDDSNNTAALTINAGTPLETLSDTFNPYNLAINSLGDSYQAFSRAAQMAATSGLNVGRNLNQNTILDAFGSVYEAYGTGLSDSDRLTVSSLMGRDRDLPFNVGLKGVTEQVAQSVSEKLAVIGDPFSFIDPYSRVMSTIAASVTSGLGLQLNKGTVRDGFEKANLNFSAQPKQMSELGVSYFRAQEQSSIFRMLTPQESGASKIIAPYEIVQKAFDEVMGNSPDTLRRLSFSIFEDGDQSTVNLVWNISEQLGDTEQEELMKKIFDFMSDADVVAKAMGKDVSELDETILKDISAVRSALRTGASFDKDAMLNQAFDLARKRGIIIGSLGSEESAALIEQYRKMGVDFSNDITFRNMMASLLRHGGDRSVLAITPLVDMDAARLAEKVGEVDAANTVVKEVIDPKTGAERIRTQQLDNYNEIADYFSDRGFLRQVTSKVRKARLGEADAVLAGLYRNYKKGIAAGTAVAGLGAFAYYKTKKNREKKLYEEVVKTQEYETFRGQDPLKDVQAVYNYQPITSSPLATAGVVGSLDRNKIGHTRMGNDRNSHLFDLR